MTISIDWTAALGSPPYRSRTTIPQAYLTFISGTLFELDTDQLWNDFKDREDDEDGITFGDQQIRAPAVTVVGVTLAPVFQAIGEIQFEDTGSAYTVRLEGTNNNLFDVDGGILVSTPLVTVIGQNSAGLIIVVQGSGLDAGQATELSEIHSGVMGQKVLIISADPATLPGFMVLYDDSPTPVLLGHKELWEDAALTIGWTDIATIFHEGPLIAGPPP